MKNMELGVKYSNMISATKFPFKISAIAEPNLLRID